MVFEKVYIPYGGYWSTPFCRWQGSFQTLHAIRFAATAGARFFQEKDLDLSALDQLILGTTIPQPSAFYGGPWLAGMMGAPKITGPIIAQACATSAKTVELAAQSIETGTKKCILTVCADRCSDGPHLVYPGPQSPGGTLVSENWVWDNFSKDPWAKNAMIQTAENVAGDEGITREEQDELTAHRYQQYTDALKDDRKFQKKYMQTPIEVKDQRGKKILATVCGDEGAFPTSLEGLNKLRPVLRDGSVTFGTQTYPADGNTGIIITDEEGAKMMSTNKKIKIQVLSAGDGRAEKGYMAKAIVPAAISALEQAGITMDDVDVIKMHTPFAVNDIYFSRKMGVDWKGMNNYGCSLVYGHPQGPTGQRGIMEMIEELVLKGGGYGLFDGCAAGDTAVALVLKVVIE